MRTLLVSRAHGEEPALSTCANLAAAGGLSGSRTLLWLAGCPAAAAELPLAGAREKVAVADLGSLGDGTLHRGILPNLDVLITENEPAGGEISLEMTLGHSDATANTTYSWCLVPVAHLQHQTTRGLLPLADEMILEVAADPEGQASLPTILEHLKEVQTRHPRIMLRGVLLHGTDHEASSTAEHEMRQLLGKKGLPLGIPHDAELVAARFHKQIAVAASASSTGAEAYRELAEALGVARPSSAIFRSPAAKPAADKAAASPKAAPRPRPNPTPPPARSPLAAPIPQDAPLGIMPHYDMNAEMEQPAAARSEEQREVSRRNEVRSFLDLEPMEPPPSGLDNSRSDLRLPRLEDHLNVYRPSPKRPIPVPQPPVPPAPKRPPSAPIVSMSPPAVSKPPSRPPSNASIQIQNTQTMRRLTQDPPKESNLPWILTAGVILLLGAGMAWLGLWANETGNQQIFVAFLVGLLVAGAVVVVGALSLRRPPDDFS